MPSGSRASSSRGVGRGVGRGGGRGRGRGRGRGGQISIGRTSSIGRMNLGQSRLREANAQVGRSSSSSGRIQNLTQPDPTDQFPPAQATIMTLPAPTDPSTTGTPSISQGSPAIEEMDHSVVQMMRLALQKKFPKKLVIFGNVKKLYTPVLHLFSFESRYTSRPKGNIAFDCKVR